MLEAIFAEYKIDPSKTVMIGDRLNTDIEFGLNGGIDTLCVLTGKLHTLICSQISYPTLFLGVTTKDELLSEENKVKSTYYIDGFGDFGQK